MATPDDILIKPITRRAIEQGFGLLKGKQGKPLAAEWKEHKREERQLEAKRRR